MSSTFNSNFRLIWIHNESGPSGIPTGFSRDNLYNERALQGSTSGGNTGGIEHNHLLPEHVHTSDTHIHYTNSNTNGPMDFVTVYSQKPVTTVNPPNISHLHVSKASQTSSIYYSTSNPSGTNSISGLLPQHITAIIIKPDSELSYIPSGIIAFTDQSTPPDNFTIASGINNYPNLNNLFVIGSTSGQNGGDIFSASSGHIHDTSGNHLHTAALHGHASATCGAGTSFNSIAGVLLPGRASSVHHNLELSSASTSDTSEDNIVTDSSASGLEPAYTKLLGIQTTGMDNIPPNLIVGYVGTSGDLDNNEWEICNGNGGTLDLSNTQIKITTDYTKIGNTDESTNYHTHESSHNHDPLGRHNHIVVATFFTSDIVRNGSAPTVLSVPTNGTHTHVWACTSVSGGIIHDTNLTTTSGDHRGPWRSMIWVRSKEPSTTPCSGSFDLFINGHNNFNASGDLFVHGYDIISISGNLFIGGSDSASESGNLFVLGSQSVITSGDLFIGGHDSANTSGNLFIRSYDTIDTSGDLFVQGYDGSSASGTLFISGYHSIPVSSHSGNLDIFIDGHNTTDTSGDLFIDGYGIIFTSVDLFIHGYDNHTASGDLYVQGYDNTFASGTLFVSGYESIPISNYSGTVDIFINGYNIVNTSIDLFIQGYDALTTSCNLYIQSHDDTFVSGTLFVGGYNIASTSGDLFIEGFAASVSTPSLFIFGHDIVVDSCDLLVIGQNRIESSNDLYIKAHEDTTTSLDLIIIGNQLYHKDISLFIGGTDLLFDDVDLYMIGYINSIVNMDLYIHGHNSHNGLCPLFINGYTYNNDNIDLIINGHESFINNTDLYIYGCNSYSQSCSLFIYGSNEYDNNITLFLDGHGFASEYFPLIIIGSGIIPYSKYLTLMINGYEPIVSTVCPLPDPTASIQIPISLIDLYQERIDAMLNQVGKNVILQFNPITSPCINCDFDYIRNRSSGRYKIGGPSPFDYGQKCPYCKGRGVLEETEELCIKCLISWNPSEMVKFGISVSKNSEIVKLKTLMSNAGLIKRANVALIDRQIINLIQYKAKLIKGPYPIGLREDRYCISFWRTV